MLHFTSINGICLQLKMGENGQGAAVLPGRVWGQRAQLARTQHRDTAPRDGHAGGAQRLGGMFFSSSEVGASPGPGGCGHTGSSPCSSVQAEGAWAFSGGENDP